MSATPETDAFIEALNDDYDYEFAALTSHSRNMERQRDLLRIQYQSTLALADALAKTINKMKAERDA
jgi:hypothetical protein